MQALNGFTLLIFNGAFSGKPVNTDAVSAIINAVDCPVQLGGGIRSMKTIARWLEAGVQRVILHGSAQTT